MHSNEQPKNPSPPPSGWVKPLPTRVSFFALPEAWSLMLARLFSLRNCLALLTLLLAFIAWNRGLTLLYGLVAMLLAVFVIASTLPWLYLTRIRLQSISAQPVHSGSTQALTIALIAKKVSYCISLTLPHSGMNTSIAFIDSRHRVFEKVYTPVARGHWLVSHCSVRCGYPFGLFVINRFVPITQPQFITVYPRLVAIKKLPKSWLAGTEQNDAYPERKARGDDLFIGLRDYQVGDPYRRIDWWASARTQALKVKEAERLEQPSLLLVINNHSDLQIGDGERNALEHSLIIAASLAQYAICEGWLVTVMGACQLQITHGGQLPDFYQQLAELKADSEYDYAEQLNNACHQFMRASIVASFNLDQGSRVEAFSHQRHWHFIFNSDSYRKPLARYPRLGVSASENAVYIPVLAADNLEGLFNA